MTLNQIDLTATTAPYIILVKKAGSGNDSLYAPYTEAYPDSATGKYEQRIWTGSSTEVIDKLGELMEDYSLSQLALVIAPQFKGNVDMISTGSVNMPLAKTVRNS